MGFYCLVIITQFPSAGTWEGGGGGAGQIRASAIRSFVCACFYSWKQKTQYMYRTVSLVIKRCMHRTAPRVLGQQKVKGEQENNNVLGDGNGNVVDGQTPLLEQVLSHVRQGCCRIDGVASYAVLFEIRRRITSLIGCRSICQSHINTLISSCLSNYELIGCNSISYSRDDDAGDANAHFGALEQFVAQIHSVPEGNEILFDFGIVSIVQPIEY